MPVRPRLPANKTPWPMKWVALAIIVFIAIYTPLTLQFRKPGHAYEPAADAERRMAEAAKWEQIAVRVEPETNRSGAQIPADRPAEASVASSNLPEGLRDALTAPPSLPTEISSVSAPAECSTSSSYVIGFTCATGTDYETLADVKVFRKGDRLILVPQIERHANGVNTSPTDMAARVTLPPGTLKLGNITIIIAASARAKQWVVTVQ